MIRVLLFLVGFLSLLGQVVLLRELNVAFYGVELIYMLALGVWLFLTALGALISRRMVEPSLGRFLLLFVIFGACVLLSVVFVRGSRILFAGVPGAYLSFALQVTVMVLALLPVSVLSGLLFQWAAKLYAGEGKTLIAAYGIESAGAAAGGGLATICLAWGVQNFALALLCALMAAVTSAVFASGERRPLFRGAATGLSGLLIVMFFFSSVLDRRMTAWNHPSLLESRDSPYGRVTVSKLLDQVSVFENDAVAFETQGTEAESFAHLAALQHGRPESVLILGGGIEGTVRELLKHGPKKVDCVELNPVMMEMVLPQLPADIGASLKHPAVHMAVDDPVRFLQRSEKYDLILIGMPEPSSGQSNRFYTSEFFARCAEKLNPLGVVSFRLKTAENFWTPQLTRRTASIHRSLLSVFQDVLVLPGETSVVTASQAPLSRSPDILVKRFQERRIETRLVSPPYIRYLFTNDRFSEIETTLRFATVPANTDVRPVCYTYAIMVWLSKFFPTMALPDVAAGLEGRLATGYWLIAAALLAFFLIARLRPSWKNALLVAVAGFAGMVLETILILYYQMKNGILYRDIGLLLTLFMAGLTLGALVIHKAMSDQRGEKGWKRWVGAMGLAALVLLSIIVMKIAAEGGLMGLLQTSLLLGAVGFLVAVLFGYASLRDSENQEKIISPLYAADLIGGCVGSLLASLILIPFLGLAVTLQGIAALAVLALLLLST